MRATTEIVQARWRVERIETHECDDGRTVTAIVHLRSDVNRAMTLEVTEVVTHDTGDHLLEGKDAEHRAIRGVRRWILELRYIPDFHIIREAKENRLFLTTAFGDVGVVSEKMRGSPDEDDGEYLMWTSVPRRDYHQYAKEATQ